MTGAHKSYFKPPKDDDDSSTVPKRGGLKRTEFVRRPTEDAERLVEWTKAVLERDENICRGCGKEANQAHHCVSRRVKKWRYDLDNGVAVCDFCHTPRIEAYLCTFCDGEIKDRFCGVCGRRGFKVPVWEAELFFAAGGQSLLGKSVNESETK